MKVAVSGHSGFIGSRLCRLLEQKNEDIVRISRKDGIDLTKPLATLNVPRFDVMVHLAANSYVPSSYEDPAAFYYNNVVSTLHALELCRMYRAGMIFLSSYVYGMPQYLPIDENHPVASINPYAESKILGERLCRAYSRDFGIPVTIFRPFNVYGKGQNDSFLIPTILKTAATGKIQLKDSRPKRDFIYVDDVVNAIMVAIERMSTGVNIYNLGSGQSHSIRELLDIIVKALPVPVEVFFSEERRPNEVLDTVSNNSKACEELNWQPLINLEQGISLTING